MQVSQHIQSQQVFASAVMRWRFITGCMIFGFLALILKVMDLGFTSPIEVALEQKKSMQQENIVSRADIVDRNGNLLASNIKTASAYAHPKQLINVSAAAKKLANLRLGLSEKEILAKLRSGKEFIWIKRHITPNEQQKIHDLGIPGVYFAKDERRVYLHENMFAHALGYVNIDGEGIAGFERLYNNQLIAASKKQEPVTLSLDIRVQNILHTEIGEAMQTHSAIGGAGLVMNVNTGEILAMVSLPDYNPHRINEAKQEHLFNQSTLGVYEMGSTFKVLTLAMGLDMNKIGINDAFDVSKPLKIGRFQIHDYKGKGGYLSVPEVLMYSSNLGVANIAKLVGIKSQQEYLRRFGLLSEVADTIPEKMAPLFPRGNKWSEASLITISYGHGIAVTGIHLAQAVAAVVNGGKLYEPTMLKHDSDDDISYKRVIKEQTSHTMRKLLRLTAAHGNARKADIEGLLVGGKTGTAEINRHGKYSKTQNVAIFTGAFPMNNPEYLVLVMIDRAKPNAINGGYTTGGMIAAPVGGKVMQRMAQVLGIARQDHESPEVLQAMYLDYTPRYVTKLAKR